LESCTLIIAQRCIAHPRTRHPDDFSVKGLMT